MKTKLQPLQPQRGLICSEMNITLKQTIENEKECERIGDDKLVLIVTYSN